MHKEEKKCDTLQSVDLIFDSTTRYKAVINFGKIVHHLQIEYFSFSLVLTREFYV